jgi:hypothetical protein
MSHATAPSHGARALRHATVFLFGRGANRSSWTAIKFFYSRSEVKVLLLHSRERGLTHAFLTFPEGDSILAKFKVGDRVERIGTLGQNAEQKASNWQLGTPARHAVPGSIQTGTYVVTAVRAHKDSADHGGAYIPVSASLAVRP